MQHIWNITHLSPLDSPLWFPRVNGIIISPCSHPLRDDHFLLFLIPMYLIKFCHLFPCKVSSLFLPFPFLLLIISSALLFCSWILSDTFNNIEGYGIAAKTVGSGSYYLGSNSDSSTALIRDLGKLCSLSLILFSHCKNGDDNSTSFVCFRWELNEKKYVSIVSME